MRERHWIRLLWHPTIIIIIGKSIAQELIQTSSQQDGLYVFLAFVFFSLNKINARKLDSWLHDDSTRIFATGRQQLRVYGGLSFGGNVLNCSLCFVLMPDSLQIQAHTQWSQFEMVMLLWSSKVFLASKNGVENLIHNGPKRNVEYSRFSGFWFFILFFSSSFFFQIFTFYFSSVLASKGVKC